MMKIATPSGEDKVLLHSCCAPCSGAIVECLLDNGLHPTVFFSNSNIVPEAEYRLRLSELRRFCDGYGVEVVEDIYDHSAWLCGIKGLEDAPERGARCLQCFRYRLLRAADFAVQRGLHVLTTSLASSRWKSLEQVNEAGSWACDTVNSRTGGSAGLIWWPQNWRKGGLQPRRSEIIKEQNFYNQQFCGCEFSKRT